MAEDEDAAYPLRTGDGNSRPLRPIDMACSKLSGGMVVMAMLCRATAAAVADAVGGLGSEAGAPRVGDAFSFGKFIEDE